MNLVNCPKCRYQHQAADLNLHIDLGPACGIAYNEWLARQATNSAPLVSPQKQYKDAQCAPPKGAECTLNQRLNAAFFYVTAHIANKAYWARFIAFSFWGDYFVAPGVDREKLGSSFMPKLNLPLHEFLLIRCDRIMTSLGGSLFQSPLLLSYSNNAPPSPSASGCRSSAKVLLISPLISTLPSIAPCLWWAATKMHTSGVVCSA